MRLFRDVAAITMDLNGVEALNVDTLGGADTVTVGDLTGTDLSAANVDLSGTPGGGGDGAGRQRDRRRHRRRRTTSIVGWTAATWSVSGLAPRRSSVAGAESAQTASASTRWAATTDLTSGVGVTGPAAIALDGGAGNDTATYSGTSAADTIGVVNNGTAVATFAPR